MKVKLLASIFIFWGCASMVPNQDNYGPMQDFERVVEVPGAKKDSLYNGIKIWIASNFKSAKAVIEYDNLSEGILIGNGAMGYKCSGNEPYFDQGFCGQNILFTTKIDVKDEKFRISYTNLSLSIVGNNRFPKAGIAGVKADLLKFGDEISESIQKTKSKSNW